MKRKNLLVIGNIEQFREKLMQLCSELNISVILLGSFQKYESLAKNYQFDVLLVDFHLDQNYDGLSIALKLDNDRSYSTLALMTEDIDKKTMVNKFNQATKFVLMPKTFKAIQDLLLEKFLLKCESVTLMIPA